MANPGILIFVMLVFGWIAVLALWLSKRVRIILDDPAGGLTHKKVSFWKTEYVDKKTKRSYPLDAASRRPERWGVCYVINAQSGDCWKAEGVGFRPMPPERHFEMSKGRRVKQVAEEEGGDVYKVLIFVAAIAGLTLLGVLWMIGNVVGGVGSSG